MRIATRRLRTQPSFSFSLVDFFVDNAQPNIKGRLSLTKAQRQTAIGVELLSLCQTITEDGSLSDQEITELQNWLTEHETSDLPAIDFLAKTVQSALFDRKITKEERQSIYKAIEKVLPSDIRQETIERRRASDASERAHQKEKKGEARARKQAEKERNKALGSWNFMVAGVRYEGRPAIISKHVHEDDAVILQREPSNPHSRNAIAICTQNGMKVGYIPEDYAPEIASLLNNECRYSAFFTKILTEGRSPIPVVQVKLYRQDATIPDHISSKSIAKSSSRVWIYGLLIILALFYLMVR